MTTVLSSIRVVDFGHWLAGPLVGKMLADFGAEVIKVDPPGRDSCTVDSLDQVLNGQKTRLKIDLKTSDGVEHARSLVADADVLIENFRPGVMSRLGLSPDSMMATNPALIYLSLPGFPAEDPRSNKPAWESLVAAACGLISERGWNFKFRQQPLSLLDLNMASAYAAAFGCLGVIVALIARQSDNRGDHIETSLYAALLEGLAYNHLLIEPLAERYRDRKFKNRHLHRRAPLDEELIQSLLDPMYRSYRCADNRFFYLPLPPHRSLIPKTLKMLNVWERLIREGIPLDDPYLSSGNWLSPEKGSVFAMPHLADEWQDRIRILLEHEFQQKPAVEWEEIFRANSLMGGVVRSRSEWLNEQKAEESGLFVFADDLRRGAEFTDARFVWTSRRGLQGDRLNIADTDAKVRDRPLDGIVVLDLCNVIAGPTVASILARFGARVIKIDPVEPNFDPFITVGLGIQAGRGKESILLDIDSPDGRPVFEQLVRHADLITFNGTENQRSELGLSDSDLDSLNSGVCFVQVSAFAGPSGGARQNDKGVDELIQAVTGIIDAVSCGRDVPEELSQFGTVDVVTGVLGAVGAAATLFHKLNTGHGATAATSLAAGSSLIQVNALLANGKSRSSEEVIIQAEDSALVANVCGSQLKELLSGSRFEESRDRCGSRCIHLMDSCQLKDVINRCNDLKIEHEVAVSYATLRNRLTQPDPTDPFSPCFLVDNDYADNLKTTLVSPCAVRFANRQLQIPSTAPKYGTDTRRIVKSLGLPDEQIERLYAVHAIADAWKNHSEFLPS